MLYTILTVPECMFSMELSFEKPKKFVHISAYTKNECKRPINHSTAQQKRQLPICMHACKWSGASLIKIEEAIAPSASCWLYDNIIAAA